MDGNSQYGGPDAALSLQEAETWAKRFGGDVQPSIFHEASVSTPDKGSDAGEARLSFSRAYSLSLSPQIIYSRSDLLACLVSSEVYRQLEFLAIGSWWVYEAPERQDDTARQEPPADAAPRGALTRVPSGREDIFADDSIDPRSKRSLMKFLKFAVDYDDQTEQWEPYASMPFDEFVGSRFNLAPELQRPLLAICMSSATADNTSTGFAVPRIARHLRSIGMFGPGFGAVVAKWGGGAEIAQVACRAGAVGGAVYMLGNDVASVSAVEAEDGGRSRLQARLVNGDCVKTRFVVESAVDTLASAEDAASSGRRPAHGLLRSVSVIDSRLSSLFPVVAEGSPQPAGAVVVFPPGSLPPRDGDAKSSEMPPVHFIVHSGETGECPSGQCVLYASVLAHASTDQATLSGAIERLLEAVVHEGSRPAVLYTLRYSQTGPLPTAHDREASADQPETSPAEDDRRDHIIQLPRPSLDLVSDDQLLENVKSVWQQLHRDPSFCSSSSAPAEARYETRAAAEAGADVRTFMMFDERQDEAVDENDVHAEDM